MKYTYVQMLSELDNYFADYGNNPIEYPDDVEDCEGDFSRLSEEDAKKVFEHNNGCVETMTQSLDGEFED